MQRSIPFNVPFVSGKEISYIKEVFENQHFAGNGPFTNKTQRLLEDTLGASKVLLTHSCTAALEISCLLLDLSPGDEVIIPSFTFVTTASSVMRCGAIPVFCEVNPETMSIDPDDAESRITEKTKAIIPVHYAGFPSDMDGMLKLSEKYGIPLIEDAAQGLGSTWNGSALGTIAPLGAISFHETKNIHSGLGGCLLVNDESLGERAEIIWERGTDRGAFFKGLVDKYSWREVGSSFYPSELQAAFLLGQLESLEENLILRKSLYNRYWANLSHLESNDKIRIVGDKKHTDHNAHMFAIQLNSGHESDRVRTSLNDAGIGVVIHYVPLHSSSMGKKLGYADADLPVTMEYSERLLRLPLHHNLSLDDVDFITSSLEKLL